MTIEDYQDSILTRLETQHGIDWQQFEMHLIPHLFMKGITVERAVEAIARKVKEQN